MNKALVAIPVLACIAGCGSNLPAGASEYVAGCSQFHKDGLQTYFNCTGKIVDFRDKVAIPVAKKQGATVDTRYVMIYKKGTYTIAATKGQYTLVNGEAEADTSKPGYGMMILDYKPGEITQ
jgi:hypothetical protein